MMESRKMTEMITSPSNPLIKQARALRQKKAREESGLFLVEGLAHVGGAVEAGWQAETVLYAPERLRSEFGLELVERLQKSGVRCQAVSASVFESFAEKENPQGLAAMVHQKRAGLADVLTAGRESHLPLFAALVTPQDPGNIGTILRTLDAVGGAGLFLLDGGADPFQPACVRASMGTLFSVPFAQADFGEFAARALENDLRLVGTSARGSLDYRAFKMDARLTVLLLGSEQKGLTTAQLSTCEQQVSLPMRGRVSSLNLAVAAGVLLYAFADSGA
jgi:RNA methyltransferase, TrmH family